MRLFKSGKGAMAAEPDTPIAVVRAKAPLIPLVMSSPHSGCLYPGRLLDATDLDIRILRRLEDSFVDELFAEGPRRGAALVHARYARAFIDTNREPFEIDARLFRRDLPAYANVKSIKARAGLGTIPSRVAGKVIYREQLQFCELQMRLTEAYWPFHRALRALLDAARRDFGAALLLDCHSMPGQALLTDGGRVIDIALGDRFGRSCAPDIVALAERFLRQQGFNVCRNRPYAGGHITAHYGRPEAAVHALQIEVRRSIYMDEADLRPLAAIKELSGLFGELVGHLGDLMAERSLPAATGPVAQIA